MAYTYLCMDFYNVLLKRKIRNNNNDSNNNNNNYNNNNNINIVIKLTFDLR